MGMEDDNDEIREHNEGVQSGRIKGPFIKTTNPHDMEPIPDEPIPDEPIPDEPFPEQKNFARGDTVYFVDNEGYLTPGTYHARCMSETSWVEHEDTNGKVVSTEMTTNDLMSEAEYKAALKAAGAPYNYLIGGPNQNGGQS